MGGRLLVTQSTLSTAIAQLEASLGTQLFVRQRGPRLTAGGRRLAKDLNGFLEHADKGDIPALLGNSRGGEGKARHPWPHTLTRANGAQRQCRLRQAGAVVEETEPRTAIWTESGRNRASRRSWPLR
ncbi:LysR family transcriptional regulator [Paenarthrobacter sp. PH39-S1]|uniref:LysR family transcriptional regulator n=1 Tax=Paenarthrobacter sp. PH39-S1 TaxID=3046204 RepID=UPI0024BA089A|nr:LysR family transcriptional regulator [Paenarthrobacter sp. PH39-S1]MDJ0355678.1 LysR family transcriptional regulator [Paenarthrobacter sp. PH39-S1]